MTVPDDPVTVPDDPVTVPDDPVTALDDTVMTLTYQAHSRIKDTAMVLMRQLKKEGMIAAGRVGACLNVVTKHLGEEGFKDKWASERTLLRVEQIMDQIELILLREHLPSAIRTQVCWDLSPQASKELLVTLLRVTWTKEDLPEIYRMHSEDTDETDGLGHEVAGTDRITVLNFVLPVVQCASKDAVDVAAKLKEQFTLAGLDPNIMSADGPVLITGDGGSENVPAMKNIFNHPGQPDNFVHVYCACHGWNLAFTHACDTIDGRSKKSEDKSTKMTHWYA